MVAKARNYDKEWYIYKSIFLYKAQKAFRANSSFLQYNCLNSMHTSSYPVSVQNHFM